MVTLEVEADAEGYRYKLSCIIHGKQVSAGEHTEDVENTVNAKYLLAINEALERMKTKTEIHIKFNRTGRHVYSAIKNGWLDKWEEKGWKNARGKQVKNKELWQQHRRLTRGQNITVEMEAIGNETGGYE